MIKQMTVVVIGSLRVKRKKERCKYGEYFCYLNMKKILERPQDLKMTVRQMVI